mmetsp:Transcript_1846/g.4517  ORF Transcript_1846/g.4517 Transcript_1846/m.4517 type:complete len:82 (-) Transcript_1846:1647-1892(-)
MPKCMESTSLDHPVNEIVKHCITDPTCIFAMAVAEGRPVAVVGIIDWPHQPGLSQETNHAKEIFDCNTLQAFKEQIWTATF